MKRLERFGDAHTLGRGFTVLEQRERLAQYKRHRVDEVQRAAPRDAVAHHAVQLAVQLLRAVRGRWRNAFAQKSHLFTRHGGLQHARSLVAVVAAVHAGAQVSQSLALQRPRDAVVRVEPHEVEARQLLARGPRKVLEKRKEVAFARVQHELEFIAAFPHFRAHARLELRELAHPAVGLVVAALPANEREPGQLGAHFLFLIWRAHTHKKSGEKERVGVGDFKNVEQLPKHAQRVPKRPRR